MVKSIEVIMPCQRLNGNRGSSRLIGRQPIALLEPELIGYRQVTDPELLSYVPLRRRGMNQGKLEQDFRLCIMRLLARHAGDAG